MKKETIQVGVAYWLVQLNLHWLFCDNYRIKNWKMLQVVITDFGRETTFVVRKIKGKTAFMLISKEALVGDKKFERYYDNNLFFHTKEEAIDKVLSIREEIESFSRDVFEESRKTTMKRLTEMNSVKSKIDKLEKQRAKL